MNHKTQDLKKKLDNLRGYPNKPTLSSSGIVAWVSECTAFFSSIGVNESIISGFMRTFESKKYNEIGPFEKKNFNDYRLKTDFLGMLANNIHAEMIYINIAFRAAENIIDNMEEREKLIPKSLLKFFQEKSEYSSISSSLELLESNFENGDSFGMASNTIALLESILNLEPSINRDDLSRKLRTLQSNREIMDKFGITKEIVVAIDNSRIIRNYMTTHKNIPIEYNIPFAVALGFAQLALLFLEIVMSTGVLIR